jgi:hypothetical protein
LFGERSFHNSFLTVLGIRLFLRGPIIRFQWQLIEVRLVPILLIPRARNGDVAAVKGDLSSDFEVGGGRLFSAVGRLSMRHKVNHFTVVF